MMFTHLPHTNADACGSIFYSRHRVLKISGAVVGLLLAGAIINVATAWLSFSVVSDRRFWPLTHSQHREHVNDRARALWERRSSDGWPPAPVALQVWHSISASGWRMSVHAAGSLRMRLDAPTAEMEQTLRGMGSFVIEQIDVGVPFRALRIEQWNAMAAPPFSGSCGHDGVDYHGSAVPVHPILIGFVANTLLYAGVVLCVVMVLRAQVRKRRLRRGQCPSCAYPIGSNSVCTECGLPVAQCND